MTDISIPLTQQVASVVSGLVLKPSYMVLVLIILFAIRSARGEDMKYLRLGLIVFWIGEFFCALDFLFCNGTNDWLDLYHSIGMVGMTALLLRAFIEFIDTRFLFLSSMDNRCALLSLCGRCHKVQPASCVAVRLFLVVNAALIGLSLMPLSATLVEKTTVLKIFGTDVVFSYSMFNQWIDFIVMPLSAAGILSLSFLFLLFSRKDAISRAKGAFTIGGGLMVYPLFRFFLLESYRRTPVWSDFWEEMTEFLLVLGIALSLYFLRHGLALVKKTAVAPAE